MESWLENFQNFLSFALDKEAVSSAKGAIIFLIASYNAAFDTVRRTEGRFYSFSSEGFWSRANVIVEEGVRISNPNFQHFQNHFDSDFCGFIQGDSIWRNSV